MTSYLLDTHVVIFSLAMPERLSAAARSAIGEGRNRISVVSYWEVVLKASRGKLDVGEPRLWWDEALRQLAAVPLTLRPEHVGRLGELPGIHNDPFDRILAAQAMEEGLVMVTADERLREYAELQVVW